MSHAYAIEVCKDSPLLYWRLHDANVQAVDISGNGQHGDINNDPALQQAGPLETIIGLGEQTYSIDFATGEFAEIDPSDFHGSGSGEIVTMEAWMASPGTTTAETDYCGVANGRSTAPQGFWIGMRTNASNELKAFVKWIGTDASLDFSSNQTLTKGEFYHVALRRLSTSDHRLVINGLEDKQVTVTNVAYPSSPNVFSVGRRVYDGTPTDMPGKVCEVAIYNSALSMARLRAHYSVGLADQWWTRVVSRNDPYLHWRLNESSGTTAADRTVHGRDGVIAGGPTFEQGSLIAGDSAANSISFDGSDDQITYDSVSGLGYPLTFEGILESPETTLADTAYCALGLFDASDPDDRLVMHLQTDGSNNLKARIFRQNGGSFDGQIGTTTLTKGQRYHAILVLRSATDAELYIAGVSEVVASDSISFPGGIDRFAAGGFMDSTPARASGVIGDIALYDSELSEAEIWAHAKVAVTSSRYARQIHSDLPAFYARLGESMGTTGVDEALGGNDLTYAGSPTLGAAGGLAGDDDTSVEFDGNDDLASVAQGILSDYGYSISAVLRTPTSPAIDTAFARVALNESGGAGDEWLTMLLKTDGAGIINAGMEAANGAEVATLTGATGLAANTFHHVIATSRAAADHELLLDGAVDDTNTTSVTFPANIDELQVGGGDLGGQEFNAGGIDEVAIFASPLSLAQAAAQAAIMAAEGGNVYQRDMADTVEWATTLIPIFSMTMADEVSFADVFGLVWLKETADTMEFATALTAAYVAMIEAADTMTVSATATAKLVALTAIEDTVSADDTMTAQARFLAAMADEINVVVTLELEGETYVGIAINAYNLAYSTYSGWDFNSFAALGDQTIGAGADGLYSLAGSDDQGAPIAASIRLGMERLAPTGMTRLPEAWIGTRQDGTIVLKVTHVAPDGERIESWYRQPRTSASISSKRIQLGQGFDSELWQLELCNEDGADFELEDIRLVPIQLIRRARS